VPGDISVVGFNNDSFAADLQLTTVHIPARELGLHAAALALDPSPTEHHTTLGTHVVVRETVAQR